MMDWLRKLTQDPAGSMRTAVARYQNRPFLDAVVAACAIVAAADGNIAPEEKRKMIGFMQVSDELSVFDTQEVIDAFTAIAKKFEFDGEIGRMEALKLTGRLRGNDGAARTMIRVCCLIGAADGNFDDKEKAATAAICRSVGLDPAEFELLPKA